MENLPYVQVTGTLESMLDKIKDASVPEKFSQDFVSTKLLVKGGAGRAIIPFVKKMGLVSSDGTPTDRYKEFRNPNKSGIAIASAMRDLYETLFEMNEYVYELETPKLKGLIVEATGAEANSTVVQKTLSTFQALRKRADFDGVNVAQNDSSSSGNFEKVNLPNPVVQATQDNHNSRQSEGINLSYTINLNLPTTTDIEVFNAIFKSLKQHLIQE
jgi:hypothetical protein